MHVRAVSLCRIAACVAGPRFNVRLILSRASTLVPAAPPTTLPQQSTNKVDEHASGKSPGVILVKVGAGEYRELSVTDAFSMSATAILKALKHDNMFANKLKDLPLDECKVWVLPGAVGDEPTPVDEKAAKELKGSNTIASILVGRSVAKAVVRIVLPAKGSARSQSPDFLRKFTVNGAVLPESADLCFVLPPDVSQLEEFVRRSTFFMLYGPRGSGKTTTAAFLLEHVRREYNWQPLRVDLSSVLTGGTPEAFWRSLSGYIGRLAELKKLQIRAFDSPDSFCAAFSRAALFDCKVVLMFDELDVLDSATPGIKEQVLGTLRAIKQELPSYSIQSIFAVGPFSILFLEGKSGSPFNVREAVPVHFFSPEQVFELLRQFTSTTGVSLEEGIAADIHDLTAGHAGLVCACGRALETSPKLRISSHVSLAAWRELRVQMVEEVLGWPTIAKMAKSVERMPSEAAQLLEQTLLANHTFDCTDLPTASMARYLAAEGWLTTEGAIGADTRYRIASPLIRSLAIRQLAQLRLRHIVLPLPINKSGLDITTVVTRALPYFNSLTMRSGRVSTKLSGASSAVIGKLANQPVPSEAVYHFQLFSILRQWVMLWGYADVFPDADVVPSGDHKHKRFADILILRRGATGAPKHILEFVASTDDKDVLAHYVRTVDYMQAHGTTLGACITFTALSDVADVRTFSASLLAWPTAEQLAAGLVAIHVVHDVAWTQARIFSQQSADRNTLPSGELIALCPSE